MEQIFKIFTGLIIITFQFFLCLMVFFACEQRERADDVKAGVIAEIENSNFNDSVISSCIQMGKDQGYEISIDKAVYDKEQDLMLADVYLSYTYEIPLLGIKQTKTLEGIAR